MSTDTRRSLQHIRTPHIAAVIGIMASAAVALTVAGRGWWCPAGDISPWSWQVNSQHNSQHLIDAYSFTHVLHGIVEFWILSLLFSRLPLGWRFVIAVAIEAVWEVVENSSYVIERYRAMTISLDYYGDSVINSLSDIACCSLGFNIGYKLKFWKSLALFIATETILMLTIRDSLIINLIMLICPVDAIKAWQAG